MLEVPDRPAFPTQVEGNRIPYVFLLHVFREAGHELAGFAGELHEIETQRDVGHNGTRFWRGPWSCLLLGCGQETPARARIQIVPG